MEETELQKQLTEIAKREGYVLLPKSYYERLFNSFETLKRDIVRIRDARDEYKLELKTLKSREASE